MSASTRNNMHNTKDKLNERGVALDKLGTNAAGMEDSSKANAETAVSTTTKQMLKLYRFGGLNILKEDLKSKINDAKKAFEKGGKDAEKKFKLWRKHLNELKQIHPHLEANPERTLFIQEQEKAILEYGGIKTGSLNPAENPSQQDQLKQQIKENISDMNLLVEQGENLGQKAKAFDRPSSYRPEQASAKKITSTAVIFFITSSLGGLFISALSGSTTAASAIEAIGISSLSIPGVQIPAAIILSLIALASFAYIVKNVCCCRNRNVYYSLLPSSAFTSSSADTTLALQNSNNLTPKTTHSLQQAELTSKPNNKSQNAPAQPFKSQQFRNSAEKSSDQTSAKKVIPESRRPNQ